ncbi:hypothetical protein CDV36_005952 [Fusarium kuroshium]|uniref:F-box domain-containing protein n=1 Tax=Fusarium kuroshium TaxID=2010991 RepID=A0A3M2SA10_9HYPO|nr:hypothetical protein CDV36_005952 [Fusarium kuroshium]
METEKERKHASPEIHPPSQPDPTLYQQRQSTLFRLPQELRLKIYEYIFSPKRLQWRFRKSGPAARPKNKPRHTLALIQTCRRVRDDLGDSWLSQVHLTFRKPDIMLDMLTELPVSSLSSIRHVRVTAESVLTQPPPGRTRTELYFLSALLKLLPGLRLDTLTVQATSPFLTFAGSEIVDELISGSSGWKELYYITREVTLLGYRNPTVRRHAQPEHWQRMMDDRDGTETKPSVTIRRSPHLIMDDNTTLISEQDTPGNWTDEITLGANPNFNLYEKRKDKRGIMVVVKRGVGVDYQEKEGSPLLEKDIRRDAPGMRWQEIQYIHDPDPHPDSFIDEEFLFAPYRWEPEEDD